MGGGGGLKLNESVGWGARRSFLTHGGEFQVILRFSYKFQNRNTQ